MMLALAGPAAATNIVISSPTSIETTVANANSGDTILLNPGTYTENDIYVGKSITIKANPATGGDASNTIIDANNAGPIFSTENGISFAVEGLTLKNAVTTTGGGAIAAFMTDVTVTSSSFVNCRGTGGTSYGGAILVGGNDATDGGDLTITSSTFTDCTSEGFGGGAIYAYYGKTTIDSTSFIRCQATAGSNGGAINFYDETGTTITSSSFKDCTGTSGGAVYSDGVSSVNIRFSRISGTGNQVYGNGNPVTAEYNWWGTNTGSAGFTGGSVTITRYLKLGLTASPASIASDHTSAVRANLTFDDSNADTSGGGVYVPYTVPVAYTITSGTGTLSTPAGNFTSGANTTTFTPSGAGTRTITARVDNQALTTNIAVSAAAPTVTGISPSSGPVAGGTSVTITGTNLGSATGVTFGSNPAAITGNTATTVTVTTPAGTAGDATVTVTTAGGTATTTYTYVAAPAITGIDPTSGPAAGGTSVTITGTNLAGATGVTFGSNSAAITGNTATQITITTPIGPTGDVIVTVTTVGGSDTTTYTYVAAPAITGIDPSAGPTAGGTSVTITGTGFVTGATVTLGGTSATDVSVESATTITAKTPAHAAGAVDVVVTNPDTQTDTLAGGYTYVAAPTITDISPSSGPEAGGNAVTITGTNLDDASVTFGASGVKIDAGTATTIDVTAPSGSAGDVTVTVTTAGGTATTTYTYVAAPAPSGISPEAGPSAGGTAVTITGTGFVTGATVTLGGTSATGVSVESATTITATAPPHTAGAVDVVVTNPDTQTGTLAGGYTYADPPTVTGIDPSSGPTAGGTSVTITGTNLDSATGVTFGSDSATIDTNTATTIDVTTPAGTAGDVTVTVTTAGGTVTTTYTYVAAPTVTVISPDAGPVAGGTAVTITGTGFGPGSTVTLGGASATDVSIESTTTITAKTPSHVAGAVDVVVTNSDTQTGTLAGGYTYADSPAVTGIDPSSGPTAGGTSVTITGTNLADATDVTFGSDSATIDTNTATTIDVTTPAGTAGDVTVTVTTAGGTATTTYTYVAAPTVTVISPVTGPAAGGTEVTITGTGFVTGATVTLGGTSATDVSVDSDTTITATTPAHAAGAVSVVVTNPDTQAGTLAAGYTYAAAPTVTAISPVTGTTAGGTAVTITGTGFVTGATVTLGGTSATDVSVESATTITATTPAHAAGAVDVVVTNTDTQAGTLTDGYTYAAAPTVSGISPVTGPATGGTEVTITGTGFVTGAMVTLGGTSATDVSVESATTITATTPAHAAGAVSVVVTNPDTQAGTLAAGYTYTGPAPVPVAGFTGSPRSGAAPLEVVFTDTTGVKAGTWWNWSFGDSQWDNSTVSSDPVHTYASAGTYDVSLTVTNASGSNTSVRAGYITVTAATPAPVAGFTGTPRSGTAPLTVVFTDTSTNTPTGWAWTFGDGSATNATRQNPVHTYASAGTYKVSLTATNDGGSNTTEKTGYITVSGAPTAPVARFTATPRSGTAPLTVVFTDTSTNTPTGWAWTFGDGSATNATRQSPVHTYASAGTYSVSLTATNAGGSNTTTKASWITVTSAGAPSVTDIRPGTGNQGALVTITNLSGTGFRSGATVYLNRTGSSAITATNVTVVSAKRITCTVKIPAGAAIGPWNLVVRNTDGKSGVLASAFMVRTVNPPTVTAVVPAYGNPGTTVTVTSLTGTGFVSGANVQLRKAGIAINATGIRVVSASKITCKFPIPADALIGPWNVRVTNADERTGVVLQGFMVRTVNPPKVISLTPSSGKRGRLVTITNLSGTGFVGAPKPTIQLMKGGMLINATNISVISPTKIRCTFALPSTAATGVWKARVVNPDNQAGALATAFRITA